MSSPFVVGIAELRRERSAPKPVRIVEEVDWGVELSRVGAGDPIDASLTITAVHGGFLVEGEIAATIEHSCSRCLDDFDEPIAVVVGQLVVDGPDDEDADYVVADEVIDLEPILRDEILLALPLRPSCGPDCRGVVDAGKTGLNIGTSDDEGDAVSPFAVLRDLLEAGD